MTTNYERIKQMTVEEIVECLTKIEKSIFDCVKSCLAENGIGISGFPLDKRIELYKQWLLEEVKDE